MIKARCPNCKKETLEIADNIADHDDGGLGIVICCPKCEAVCTVLAACYFTAGWNACANRKPNKMSTTTNKICEGCKSSKGCLSPCFLKNDPGEGVDRCPEYGNCSHIKEWLKRSEKKELDK